MLLGTALWQPLGADSTHVKLQLRWDNQFQFAGYYVAQWKGYYEEEALNVEVLSAVQGTTLLSAVKEVAEGRVDFGIGASDILLAVDQGKPLVVVSSIFQESAAAYFSLKETPMNSVAELAKLKLARTEGDLIDIELQALFHTEGVDFQKVSTFPHESGLDHLLSGKVDAVPGYTISLPYNFKAAGKEYNLLRPSRFGLHFYGDSLFTTQSFLENHRPVVDAFARASLKGWKYALDHPAEVIDLIVERLPRDAYIADPKAFNQFQAQGVADLMEYPMVEPGHSNPQRWQRMYDTLLSLGVVKKPRNSETFLYDTALYDATNTKLQSQLTGIALGVVLGLVVLSALWIVSLRQQVTKKTRELQQVNTDLLHAQHFAQVGSWTWNKQTGLLNCSEELYRLFDVSPETNQAALVPALLAAVHPDDKPSVEGFLLAMGRETQGAELEFRVIPPGKPVRTLWVKVGDLTPDRQGVLINRSGFLQDISGRKQAEKEKQDLQAQLNQSQKMEVLGNLAGGIAHDMNNILAAILSLASAKKLTLPPDHAFYRTFDTISKAAERGGAMVKNLLAFTRKNPVEQKLVDLNAVLLEEIRLLENTVLSKVQMELQLEHGLPPVLGDAGALSHAFMNLCVNAVDSMTESGVLTLRTRQRDAQWIEVDVQDTGTGMSKEVLERALDPYYTTKPMGKGTGLGLSLVYTTVTSHGGLISLQSEPGKGTLVQIRFPSCPQTGSAPETETAFINPLVAKPLSILVVDDDKMVQESMHELLGQLGHQIDQALSGEEGFAKLQAGSNPDVIVLDIYMPGWGGRQTLEQIRLLKPELSVLLVTGRPDQALQELVEHQSRVSLLCKPFQAQDLALALQSAVQSGPAGS